MDSKFIALNKEYEQITCQILATFFMDKKNYLFYRDDEENIYVGYVENSEIKQIINNEEFKKTKKVFDELKGINRKPKFVELATQYYKGIPYKTIYDNMEDSCFTYQLLNGKFKEVEEEVKEHFNALYNENINILFMEEKFKKYNKNVKKIIKIEGVFLSVIIFGNISFNTLKLVDLNKGFIQNIDSIVEMHQIDENDADFVMSYIKNNDKIQKPEKDFILKQEHFFKENEEYFDMPSIKKNLMNLKIVYDKNNYKKYELSDKVKGFYNNYDDKIVILYSDCISDYDPFSQQVLFHEMMHAMTNSGYVSNGSLGNCLSEGLTELMAEEYLESYSDTYNKNQTYARIMCELVGPETIRKSFLKGNIDMLIDELSKIDGTDKDAKKFISLLDTEAEADSTILKNLDPQKVEDAKKTLLIVQPNIDAYLKKYYEAKFKTSMNNDSLMKAYYDSLRLTNTLNNENYQEGNMLRINVVKNYFNSNLSKEEVIIEYYYLKDTIKTLDYLDVKEIEGETFTRTLSEFPNGKEIVTNSQRRI